MRRALELAERGSGRVNPNPLVGALVINDGEIVAEAYHERSGCPHAEALALQEAGESARGGELYVNWEPCVAFPGKQTPPCVDRIIESGIRRVIVATRDPSPQVDGRGIAQLRDAGIEVIEGVLEGEAKRLNEIRAKYATTGLPFVTLKMALTADGKVATRTGDARWISSEESLQWTHRLRARYAAVLVGIGTVLCDDPQLTVRHGAGRDPVRIALDSQGKIPPSAALLHVESEAPTVIAACEGMLAEKEQALRELPTPTRIEVWRLPPGARGGVDLHILLEKLGAAQVDSVLVEGGPTVAAGFLEAQLIDKLMFFLAPKIVGGQEAPSPIVGKGVERIAQAYRLRDVSVSMSGPDVVYQAYLDYSDAEAPP